MAAFENAKAGNRLLYGSGFFILLLIAFLTGYHTTGELLWVPGGDFYRDMAFAQGFLNDGFGKDPNFPGQYIWYNPLLTTIEAGLKKLTGMPLQTVIVRGGLYLNLMSPLAFFMMMCRLTDWKKALAAALSYLFLASGMLPCYYTATYSPWAFPNCFIQFIFFVNLVLCYQALETRQYKWFAVLGFFSGISFLGHTSPTLLLLLILISIQVGRMFKAIRQKNYPLLGKHLLQSMTAFVPFILVSMPLLYYIIGKYHMRILNMAPFEYVDTIFIWRNWRDMIGENASIWFLISLIGFAWFWRHERNRLVRMILLRWGLFALLMYIYSSAVAGLDRNLHIRLPGTVPSFHYFVYLKALQSVFFGYGFLFLAGKILDLGRRKLFHNRPTMVFPYADLVYVALVLMIAMAYYPVYQQRPDFHSLKEDAVHYQNDSTGIAIYNFIMDHIPSDKVILCGEHHSFFPVMASARKMVSIGITFSNPYLDFAGREADRVNMMSFLGKGQPKTAEPLLQKYNVDYVLMDYTELPAGAAVSPLLGVPVYQNSGFRLFALKAARQPAQ